VSPLKRALQTAVEVFKQQKTKPNFIANPLLREGMASICDIPSRTHESMEIFPFIDFSFLKQYKYPSSWLLENLP